MALTAFSYLSRNYALDWPYIVFVGSSTLLTYSIHRLIGIRRSSQFMNIGRFAVVKRFKNHIVIYAFLSAITCMYYFFHFSAERQVLLATFGVISLLYTLPVFGKGRRLRDFAFIKILLISLTWAFVTEGLILFEHNASPMTILIALLGRFCFILAITIPFDIRDMVIDRSQMVRTLATSLGELRSKYISYSLLIFCTILAYTSTSYDGGSLVAIALCYLIAFIAIFFTNRERSDYWYTGLLDGLMIVPLILLLLFR